MYLLPFYFLQHRGWLENVKSWFSTQFVNVLSYSNIPLTTSPSNCTHHFPLLASPPLPWAINRLFGPVVLPGRCHREMFYPTLFPTKCFLPCRKTMQTLGCLPLSKSFPFLLSPLASPSFHALPCFSFCDAETTDQTTSKFSTTQIMTDTV